MRVTLLQSALQWERPDLNREAFSLRIRQMIGQTDLFVLPEMFTTGFTMQAAQHAEPAGSLTLHWMQEHAAASGACVVGSFVTEEGGQYFNRLHWVWPSGQYATYNKRHLFSLAGEDAHYTKGTEKLIVEWMGLKICPLICYDLRFPVWSRNTEGYDLAIYIANWPAPRIEAWRTLLKARAIENQCYVVGLNIVGKDGMGLEYSGASAVINYAGEEELFASHQSGAFTVQMEKARLDAYRSKFRFLQDMDEFDIKI